MLHRYASVEAGIAAMRAPLAQPMNPDLPERYEATFYAIARKGKPHLPPERAPISGAGVGYDGQITGQGLTFCVLRIGIGLFFVPLMG